jgi:hypothetical protein
LSQVYICKEPFAAGMVRIAALNKHKPYPVIAL